MLDFLKNSKGQILALFFNDPEKEYYLREIAKILKKEPGAIQSYLNSLVKDQILLDEKKANLRFFKLNKNHPLYEEIKKIISKTLGIESHLKKLVDSIPNIDCAFIFGSIAKNTEISGSDIDIMLIGQPDEDILLSKINSLEDLLKREINYLIYSKENFKKNLRKDNDFFVRILNEPTITLRGDINEHK